MTADMSSFVLVTGFRQFEQRDVNGAETLARALHGETVAGHRIESRLVNVVWNDVERFCRLSLPRSRARLILSIGEASRPTPSFETVALPKCEGEDVTGRHAEKPIDTLAPAKTRLAFEPAWFEDPDTAPQASTDAGAYLCNYIMMLGLAQAPAPFGFLHVPVQGTIEDDVFRHRYMPVVRTLIAKNLEQLDAG